MTYQELSTKIIGAAIEVHRELGPGLLESIHEDRLVDERIRNGLKVESKVEVPVHYKGRELGRKMRIDLWVDRRVIVEGNAIEFVLDAHKAQLLTYMKLTGAKLGLLINFNEALLKKGIVRRVNGLDEERGPSK